MSFAYSDDTMYALGFRRINGVDELRVDRQYVAASLASGDDYYVWQLVQCRCPGVLKVNGLDDILPTNKWTLQDLRDDPDDEFITEDDD